MTVDDELNRAADDLRRELQSVRPPPLDRAATTRGGGIAGRVVLVMASLVVFGVGAALLVNGADRRGDNEAIGTDADLNETTLREGPPQDEVVLVDPVFGTSLQAFGPPEGTASAVLPLPGGSPAWNADESLLLLYEVGAGHAIYDADTFQRINQLDVDPVDIEQVYWDPADPLRVLTVTGGELIGTEVTTGASTVLHRFEGCDVVQTTGVAKPISTDGRWFGALCEQGAERELVAVDVGTGREVRRATSPGSLGPVPLPDGSGFVTRSGDGDVEVLDQALEPTGVSFSVGTDLFALIRTADGRQLFVTTVFERPAEAIGSVVGFDLATGAATVAIGEAAGDPYPPSGTRLAGSVAGTGQVVVSIVGDASAAADPAALDGKVFLVDFDPVDAVVTPIAGHGAPSSNSALDPFWIQPYPAVAADGSQVMFSAAGGTAASVFVASSPEGGTP